MSTKKIILTKPLTQARPLAQKLTDLGYSVSIFPLWEIAPLTDTTALRTSLANLSGYALAVFVSPNAIHAIFQNGFAWPSNVAIAVMGEGSRSALSQYNINAQNTKIYCPTDPNHSDSEALLEELDLTSLNERGVIIFRAETGRELLSDALTARGIRVEKAVAYRRLSPNMNEQSKQQFLTLLTQPNYWAVSSSEAIRTLLDLIREVVGEKDVAKLQQHMQHVHLLVSHQRIVETAEKCGYANISLIGSGDENLLLALQSQP